MGVCLLKSTQHLCCYFFSCSQPWRLGWICYCCIFIYTATAAIQPNDSCSLLTTATKISLNSCICPCVVKTTINNELLQWLKFYSKCEVNVRSVTKGNYWNQGWTGIKKWTWSLSRGFDCSERLNVNDRSYLIESMHN